MKSAYTEVAENEIDSRSNSSKAALKPALLRCVPSNNMGMIGVLGLKEGLQYSSDVSGLRYIPCELGNKNGS